MQTDEKLRMGTTTTEARDADASRASGMFYLSFLLLY
jgi:hypothetical protein